MNMINKNTNLSKETHNTYLNLSPDHFTKAVMKAIRKGSPVWFACDYGEYLLDRNSLLNTNASNLNLILNTASPQKKEALKARVVGPNHAMVILGYNTPPNDPSIPNRWKVENSHGPQGRHSGFLTMTQRYFDDMVLVAVVPKSCVGLATTKSKWLPFHSVLGTVANS
jgi:bleomycin hydrolase